MGEEKVLFFTCGNFASRKIYYICNRMEWRGTLIFKHPLIMKGRCLLWILLLLAPIGLRGQVVRFGQYEVRPEQNVLVQARRTRGLGSAKSSLELGLPLNGKVNVLMQFAKTPTASDLQRLEAAGVALSGYVGGNAYYAQVEPGKRPADFRDLGAVSVMTMRPEWKLATPLVAGEIPDWARRGNGDVAVTVHWFGNASVSYVRSYAAARGWAIGEVSEVLQAMVLTLPADAAKSLAAEPWVQHVALVDPPQELLNYGGRVLGAAMPATQSLALGGRGLMGKGVRIGLWDGNIENHVDYGNRTHVLEFETSVAESGGHGMHTAGTLVGAGILNPLARGMAPKAELYASNFNTQRNGLSVAEEMEQVYQKYNIALTSNSYGVQLGRVCDIYDLLSYSFMPGPMLTDMLSNMYPTMTHFFSAGNSQGECDRKYGSNMARAKNVIYVGAADEEGWISDFSSFGPTDDGRLVPTVSAKGVDVTSTVGANGYEEMSGTSMACPTAAGLAALLTERYHQMHGGMNANSALVKGLLANTADDMGNDGPDYEYGYGIVNLEAALTSLEQGWYTEGVVERGKAPLGYTIKVPNGVKRMRVMLTWIDPAVVKEYPYGESVLINDLDLAVDVAGAEVLPWVLDPANPGEAAVRGKDHRNNIEQVTIENPTGGAATVRVTGSVKEGTEQKYVLTWYFDYGSPYLLHPIGGEQFEPGDVLLVRANNTVGRTLVEISYDDGKTYEYLGGVKDMYSVEVDIPEDAPQTTMGRIRLTDSKGSVVVSPKPFTIAPRPSGVKLEAEPCSVASWKLVWKPAGDGLTYVVLKADVPSGEWTKINEVTDTTYSIQGSEVTMDGRNVFAVAVKMNDGSLGPRSMGVLVKEPTPLALTSADIPFSETFINIPLPNAKLSYGKSMSMKWMETPANFEFPLGSHMLSVRSNLKLSGAVFENDTAVFTLRHCELTLPAVASGEKLLFYSYNVMTPYETAEDTQLRLQADGATVKTTTGAESYTASGEVREMVWDLSAYAGKKITLDLQFSSNQEYGRIKFMEYGIRMSSKDPDVGLYLNQRIQRKPNMGIEELQMVVYNSSMAAVSEVPLVVSLDGKQAASLLVKDLKPFEERVVTIPVDFSTTDKQGHEFQVTMAVSLAGDVYPRDNKVETKVYSMGDIFPLPPAEPRYFLGMKLLYDPRIVKKVDAPIIFTDDGGLLHGYGRDHISSVKFVPTDPNKVIYIAFRECEMRGSDVLQIYADGVSHEFLADDFKYLEEELTYEYNAKTGSGAKAFVSRAVDGSLITFFNDRYFSEPGDGWVAEVRQVDRTNSLQLEPLAVTYEGDSAKVVVKVKNNTPIELKDLAGKCVREDLDKVVKEFTIASVPANGEATMEVKVAALPPTRAGLTVTVQRTDFDMSYSTQHVELWNDRFWKGGVIKDTKWQGVKNIMVPPEEAEVQSYGARQDYEVEKSLKLYTKTVNPLFVMLEEEPTQEDLPSSIHVWIDLDDQDDGFKDNALEHYSVALEEGETDYEIPIDLTAATGVKAGKFRMRVAVLPDVEKDKFIAGDTIAWGRSVDVTAEVIETINPNANDLEVRFRGVIASGASLSSEQKVSAWVINNGYHAVKDVPVELYVNGKLLATEKVAEEIPPFYENAVAIDFAQTVDLSWAQEYTLELKIPDDSVKENNVATQKVLSVLPSSKDKIYGLEFVGKAKGAEKVEMPPLAGKSDKVTLEGWFKLDKPQFATLFQAAGLWVVSTYQMVGDLPDNAIAIIAGRRMLRCTPGGSFEPGQFHHVALTFVVKEGFFESSTDLNVYIDGKKMELDGSGDDAAGFSGLTMGSKLKGLVKMFRLWTSVRSEDDILGNMWRSVRDSAGNLPEDCAAEFMMNEGAHAYLASGQAKIAEIVSERVDAAKGSIWKELTNLVSGVDFKGQLFPSKVESDGAITFIMPHGFSSFAEVTGKIVALWPGTKLIYQGKEVTEDTKFDFSGTNHEITVTASKTLFGISLEQKEAKIRMKVDENPEAKILKLQVLTANNPNMQEDIDLDNPGQTIGLKPKDQPPAQAVDLTQLKVTFTKLSDGAQLYYKGEKVAEGATLALNLESPVSVKVVAKNGRNVAFYTLHAEREQAIVWNHQDTTLVYTSAVVPFGATSSAGLPVVYHSSDPSVVMIDAAGNLHTAGVGVANLMVTAAAGKGYAAAAPKTLKAEVTRAALTITPQPMTMKEGEEVPAIELLYDGLLFNEVRSQVKQPIYKVYKATQVWDPSMGMLGVGTYDVKPSGATTYEDGNYKVTLQNGKLEVTPSTDVRKVGFVVVDDANTAVDGAAVEINGVALTTVGGKASIRLTEGSYPYSVTKEGYQLADGEVQVGNADVSEPVSLLKLKWKLSYTVSATDGHGAIFGEKSQMVPEGGSGTPVTAVPDDGYVFDKWSDNGSTDVTREDTDVHADVNATASFKPITFTVSYNVGEGGEWGHGEQRQMLQRGQDGTEVEVKAKAGYIFLGWSDGVRSEKRSEKAVEADITLEAQFYTMFSLPLCEDFEYYVGIPYAWSVDNHSTPDAHVWTYGTHGKTFKESSKRGSYMYVDSDGQDISYSQNTDLYTPWLDIKGVEQDIEVSYDLFFRTYGYGKMSVLYSFDGVQWDTIAAETTSVPFGTEPRRELTIEAAKVAGQSKLQVKWHYEAIYDGWVAVDNIHIAAKGADRVIEYYAGEHGKLESATSAGPVEHIRVTTPKGTLGEAVTAVPNSGYAFYRWVEDNKLDATRQDSVDGRYTASFKLAPTTKYTLTYTADERGRIEGFARQQVGSGENSIAVTAVALNGKDKFVKWSDGRTDNPRVDSDVTKDDSVEAQFSPRYKVNMSTDGWGELTATVNGSPLPEDGIVDPNTKVTFTAQPDDGYKVAKWKGVTFTQTAPEATRELEVVKDTAVSVDFEPIEVALTFVVVKKGTSEAIPGAAVQLDGMAPRFTDAEGKVVYEKLHYGKYNYSVSLRGGLMVASAVEVRSNVTKQVELQWDGVEVIFVVKDGTNTVEGAVVTVDGTNVETNSQGEAIFSLAKAKHDYTVERAEYESKTGTVDLTATTGQPVKEVVQLSRAFKFTLTVTDGFNPVEGAKVKVAKGVGDTVVLVTPSTGTVEVKLVAGTYNYSVKRYAFEAFDSSVTLATQNEKQEVALQRKEANLNFKVMAAGGGAVTGAKITIDGNPVPPVSATGGVSAKLPVIEGHYYVYKVEKEGYLTVKDSVELKEGGTNVEVTLEPSATATFVVKGADGKLVEGATVEVDGNSQKTDGGGKAAIVGLKRKPYDYTVKLEGYEDASGSVNMSSGDVTENVTLKKLPTATFTVEDGDHPGTLLAGVAVTIEGKFVTTGSDGKASLAGLEKRVYSYTVSMGDYQQFGGNVDLSSGDQEVPVKLYRLTTATFVVKGADGKPVKGAMVAVDGKSQATDGDGKATIVGLKRQTYSYTVKLGDYEDAKGSVNMSNGDVTENVTLKKLPAATFVVKGADNKPIAGAMVAVGGKSQATDGDGKAVIAGLEKKAYDYTVKLEGYKDAKGSVDLSSGDQEVAVTLEKTVVPPTTAAATFVVKGADGKPVVGATVAVDGKSQATDGDGKAVIAGLEKRAYDYTVSKEGYKDAKGSVDLSSGDQEVAVTLEKTIVPPTTAAATFVVKGVDGKPLAAAMVAVGGKSQATDGDGKAVIAGLEKKAYDYTVKMEGYKDAKGSVDLSSGDQEVAVTLEKATPVESVVLSEVTLRPNPATTVLYVENVAAVERLSVVSMGGVTLLQHENAAGESAVRIVLEDFAEGTYLLVVESQGERRALPFAVRR